MCPKDGDMQKTVLKFVLRGPNTGEMYEGAGEDLVLETVDWIRWEEVFRCWMISSNYINKFSSCSKIIPCDPGDAVTCAEVT